MDYAGKKALVLGLGESGMAMARWLARCGANVRVADTREGPERLDALQQMLPAAEFCGGPFTGKLLESVDMLAVSPGLMPGRELAGLLPLLQAGNIPFWSEIELFAQALAALREKRGYRPGVLAITGTNGKTTVTSLTGKMCAAAGKSVKVAGNISPAVLDVLRESLEADTLPDIWVLELSSFQLWSTYSLNADAATVLNVTQDHLDWHGTMTAYSDAKRRIFGASTIQVLNRDDSRVMAMASPDHRLVTFGMNEPVRAGDFGIHNNRGMDWLCVMQPRETEVYASRKNASPPDLSLQNLMPVAALHIRGRHNAGNALAALALCRAIGLPLAPLLHALRAYRGEAHRMTSVMTVSGVSYIDDSKGTNVGATVAAVESLGMEMGGNRKRLLLIAGGDGKDQDFSPLALPVSKYVRTVLLIGKDAALIEKALKPGSAEMVLCESLEQAVKRAAGAADEGDVVLLSPACASMDMFRNYAHRAEVFVSAVREMALSRGEVVL
ncbi:MAG: UDP-N-acetylmuramoyl-L-alanine--D-glutamate ligase [Burkholderiaceae bacterium]|jgi:UDP-N-acetylmuramoylalanine--D-glutamate ligase|nr:UDP-N-acetylmuramoyl-L-alanine--D-glutamate ligase [Burkholderiaceae bacterium]